MAYHYSLSPQKPKKVTGSRLIVLKTPYNKLLSPQPLQHDLFTDQGLMKPLFLEKYKKNQRNVSSNKVNDSKLSFSPILDISKFNSPQIPMLSVIGLKEAIRDREWVQRARESLTRELSEFINYSNGLETENPTNGYKYHLGKGNNIALIKKCFNSRWWWNEDSSKNANIIWTQTNSRSFFDNIQHPTRPPKDISFEGTNQSVKCSVFFQSDTLEEKIVDISNLGYDFITKSESFIGFDDKVKINPAAVRSHNKLEYNYKISNKKELYLCLKNYYLAIGTNVFNVIPETFHIKNGEDDPEFSVFSQRFSDYTQKIWIIKPGENTNRGNGIVICDSLEKIKSEIKNNPFPDTGEHTYIIQRYIEKPFLVNKRKFDIRLYTLVTSTNGVTQCYFYQEGYIRTSSKDYSSKSLDNKFIHLTNDAIQKKSEDYGKYENGNKMSYKDFQRYLDNKRINKNFNNDILPRIKNIVVDTIKASFLMLDKRKRKHTFEIFGYDFLLDRDLNPWLLEVNSNPCLELSSTILARIIPAMVENAFKIAVDPIFPEPLHSPKRFQGSLLQDLIPENKFELVFHEAVDGKEFLSFLSSKGTLENYLKFISES
jgi:tubulin polyglutamylase TTLL1